MLTSSRTFIRFLKALNKTPVRLIVFATLPNVVAVFASFSFRRSMQKASNRAIVNGAAPRTKKLTKKEFGRSLSLAQTKLVQFSSRSSIASLFTKLSGLYALLVNYGTLPRNRVASHKNRLTSLGKNLTLPIDQQSALNTFDSQVIFGLAKQSS